jgi:hypothetical protein
MVMQVHMDATLEPARRMITKLLEAYADFSMSIII